MLDAGLASALRFPPPHTPPPLNYQPKKDIYVFRQVIPITHIYKETFHKAVGIKEVKSFPHPDLTHLKADK